jgi:hypothetical protein
MTEIVGIIALTHCQDLELLARSAPVTRPGRERIQPWDDSSSLIPLGRRRARGQRPASTVREAVPEDTLACSAIGGARTAACARRGKRRHPRPRMATAGGRAS